MCGEAFWGEIRVLPPGLAAKPLLVLLPAEGIWWPGSLVCSPRPAPSLLFPILLPRSVPARDGSPSGPQSFACPQACVLPCSRLVMLLRGSADVLCWLGPTKLLASWAPTVLALGGCTESTCPTNPPSPPYAPKSLWDLASAPGPISAPRPSCRQAKATQPGCSQRAGAASSRRVKTSLFCLFRLVLNYAFYRFLRINASVQGPLGGGRALRGSGVPRGAAA